MAWLDHPVWSPPRPGQPEAESQACARRPNEPTGSMRLRARKNVWPGAPATSDPITSLSVVPVSCQPDADWTYAPPSARECLTLRWRTRLHLPMAPPGRTRRAVDFP